MTWRLRGAGGWPMTGRLRGAGLWAGMAWPRLRGLYSMLCNKQLLRPRFGMQLDAQSADDLENRVDPWASLTRQGLVQALPGQT